jgi:hypothetical protein
MNGDGVCVQRISKPARTTVGDLENEGEMSSNIFKSTNSLLVNAAEEEAGRRTHLKSKVRLGLAGCAADCYKLARVVGTRGTVLPSSSPQDPLALPLCPRIRLRSHRARTTNSSLTML